MGSGGFLVATKALSLSTCRIGVEKTHAAAKAVRRKIEADCAVSRAGQCRTNDARAKSGTLGRADFRTASLQPLDLGNGLFSVHPVSISNISTVKVKLTEVIA